MDKTIVRAWLIASAGLTALVPASRIYLSRVPRSLPSPPTAPYIIYKRVTGTPVDDLDADPATDQQRVQIDIFADTQTDAEAIVVQVRAALKAYGHEVLAQDFSELEPDLERITLDWEFIIPR